MPDYLENLKTISQLDGFSEVLHCQTFKCYRHTESQGTYEVKVEVFDMGEVLPDCRFSVIATRVSDGKQTSGNSRPTLKEALAVVHWWVIDKLESPVIEVDDNSSH